VAVAYIGTDWNTYIPEANRLEDIIVSPTLGSNPWAIVDLVKQIGWEKVCFLDNLHAKVYVGKGSAVIGSANLTRNGLSGEGLVELCAEVSDEKSLEKLTKAFNELKRLAQDQYPTKESKKTSLQDLEKKWNTAIANRLIRNDVISSRSFAHFELLGDDHFYVVWYQPVDHEHSDDLKAMQQLIDDEIHFTKKDKVESNKWVLVWRKTDAHTPHLTQLPYWLYIHQVFDEGIIKKTYPYRKCAIQRNDLKTPPQPFELTGEVRSAFKKAIQEEDVSKYLIQKEKDIFDLAYSQKGIPLLVCRMKEYLAKESNGADAKRRKPNSRRSGQ
jgi:hypothetical protein